MKYKYRITGLDCPNCAAKLQGLMERCEGVDGVKINFLSERLTVESSLSEGELLPLLTAAARSFSRDIEIV